MALVPLILLHGGEIARAIAIFLLITLFAGLLGLVYLLGERLPPRERLPPIARNWGGVLIALLLLVIGYLAIRVVWETLGWL